MGKDYKFYIGTYSRPVYFGTGEVMNGRGLGVYCLSFNPERNTIDIVGTPQDTENPSYVAINKDNTLLFAVNELRECDNTIGGRIVSFRIDPQLGSFELVSVRNTFGEDPCHIQIDEENHLLFVSNYSGGSASVFKFDSDGVLSEEIYHLQHKGKGANELRQEKPHIHSSLLSPDNHNVFFVDLGIDMIESYSAINNGIDFSQPHQYKFAPGSGPRACVFNNNGKICYVVNELSNTISVLSYDKQTKHFNLIQSVSTLHGIEKTNTAATICLSKKEDFLFVSNRGLDEISIYVVNEKTGLLEYKDCVPSGGKTPRHFSVSCDGKYLVCCNQDSDNISIFYVENGNLQMVCSKEIPNPSCVAFVKQ